MPGETQTIENTIDQPEVKTTSTGSLYIARKPRAGRECDWLRFLIDRYDAWRDLVDMPSASKIEVERSLLPSNIKNIIGAARADAIIWHGETACSIIEAKVDPTPVAIAGGIGQLLYYRTLATRYWGVKVNALLLASPTLPPFILETIAECEAPVRFLKRDSDDNLSGLVPRYA